MDAGEIVALNVGGKRFEVRLETLVQIPFFRQIYAGEFERRPLDGPPLFLDRCPGSFKHVLRLLRNPKYDFPEKHAEELNFYGIEYERTVPAAPTALDLSAKDYPILAWRRYWQLGSNLMPKKSFIALKIVPCHDPNGFQANLLVSEQSDYSECHMNTRWTKDEFVQRVRLALNTMGVEIREFTTAPGNITHFYAPARLRIKLQPGYPGLLFVNRFGMIPDYDWYAQWCTQQ
jgi:hypothetical protein